jgi:osmotically-inducible protein OsmY
MKYFSKAFSALTLGALLSVGAWADTTAAARYDAAIESRVTTALADKKEFRDLRATVEDGIVTLTGNVELYQQKLNAASRVRKMDKVQGVRNLIEVSSTVPDAKLAAQLDRKLYYDRIGYDNAFNYVTVSVNGGVATLIGEVKGPVARDSAIALANNTPGVKEVVDNLKVSPVSAFDDEIRLRAVRAIYGDAVLGRYAIDPALYGTVQNQAEKQIAGIKAGQVFGVFSVKNNLVVAKES